MKKVGWILFIVLGLLVGLYPGLYFILDRKFALLSSKPELLLNNTYWNIGFYGHIILGGFALLIGWVQFSEKVRKKRISLHRKIGKAYVISVLVSSICGFYIAFYATGGLISQLGFMSLAVIWFTSTLLGFNAIKKGDLESHKRWMIYSYAACFAAVTLRIWLPILIALTGGFNSAYLIVAWLCWVPNIAVAYFMTTRKHDLNTQS